MVHTLGWLGMAGISLAHSGLFQFILGESSAIWLVLVIPGVHHSFFTPDPNEGSLRDVSGGVLWVVR